MMISTPNAVGKARRKPADEPQTVAQLADAKGLPARFLSEQGLENLDGGGIAIPYYDTSGTEMFRRSRGVPGGPRFRQPKGVALVPYGLWRLPDLNPEGVLHLCEGESDTLTLWHQGFDAIGLPGANCCGCLKPEHLAGVVELYIVPDNDQGGAALVEGVAKRLADLGFAGRASVVRMPDGIKDVNELHQLDPDHFREQLDHLKRYAKAVCLPTRNGAGNAAPSVAVRESVDDPHRLARTFMADAGGVEDCPTPRHWRDEYYRWENGHYRRQEKADVKAGLVAHVKAAFDADFRRRVAAAMAAANEAGGDADEAARSVPPARKVGGKVVSDVSMALASLANLPGPVEPPAWVAGDDCRPTDEFLVTPGSLVHLPSLAAGARGAVSPPRPELFATNALGCAFEADAAAPSRWLAFLNELWGDDPECIAALQEWFGYSLTSDTSQQKILMIVGPKRSGKGTIVRVQRALLGPDNTCAPTLSSLGLPFGLQPLLGKTLATITDARLSHRSDLAAITERLLSISGEDGQTIDRKHLPSVTVSRMPIKFTILTNELPALSDAAGALVGRLLILRQTKSWFGREDKSLTPRLLAELPGILLWAIEGWRRLRDRGRFSQPASAAALVRQMEDLSSPVGAFVRERCAVGPGKEVETADLFSAWKSWCEAKDIKPGTDTVFGRNLRAVVPGLDTRQPRQGAHRIRVYTGVALQGDEEEFLDTPF